VEGVVHQDEAEAGERIPFFIGRQLAELGIRQLLSYARREIDAIAKLVPARNSTLSDHAALLLPSGP